MSDMLRGVVPDLSTLFPEQELDLMGAYKRGNTVPAQRARVSDEYRQRQEGIYTQRNPRPETVSMEQALAQAKGLSQGVGLAPNTSPEAAADRASRYTQRMQDNWKQNNPAPEGFDVSKTIEQAEMLRDALGIGTPKKQHWATTFGQHLTNAGHAARVAGGADPQAHADFIQSISAPSQQGTEFLNKYVLDAFDAYGKQRGAYQKALSEVGSTKGPSLTEMETQPVVDVQAEAQRIYDKGQKAQTEWLKGRDAAMEVTPPGVDDLLPLPVDTSINPNDPVNPVNAKALRDQIQQVLGMEESELPNVDPGFKLAMQQILGDLNVSLAKKDATPLTNKGLAEIRKKVISLARSFSTDPEKNPFAVILEPEN